LTAAASEKLAGKAEVHGVNSYDGSLARSGGGHDLGEEDPQEVLRNIPQSGNVTVVMQSNKTEAN
jgi:hypothetical protein